MRILIKPAILLLLITATATITMAQQFGGNPPSIKWQQINTPAAKVIFPKGLDSSALRVANIVQQMNRSIQPTIGYKQRQVSILLQNQTTISNAYVGLAPFRSEFYLTPTQNSFEVGSLSWPDQLAIHEFRHVQQYNNFNVGISHTLKFFFGESGQALGNALAIPDWFFEGDAVFNETHVSEQGRGRLPFFFNGYRSLWADGRDYSYMKLRNGSYRDYTPDWYPLGYMLVSYGRQTYGDDFWKKVTHDAAAYKSLFYPLQNAVKKYSGKDFNTFTNDGLNHFKQIFSRDLPKPYNYQNQSFNSSSAKKGQHFIANREYPVYVNDSTMIYVKSTYDRIPEFVIKTVTSEKRIAVRDISLDHYFAYRGGKIIYSAYRPDLRWRYRDYSEIMVLDVATGEERRIGKKTRYFTPDFSADGQTIVTVKEGTNGKSELHLLSATDGKLIAIVPNKENLYYTYPKFYGNDKLIVPIRNTKGKMSIALINAKTGDAKYLLPFSYRPIAFPLVRNDTVYFSETSGINDRIFALSLNTNKLFELGNYNLNGSVGNYQPALATNKFAWVGFTAFGYQVNETNKNDLKWQATDEPGELPTFGISALKRDESTDLLAGVKDSTLSITKYHKSYHLFNFHSLMPDIDDPNYTLTLQGENVLNTLQSNLLFTYNNNEGYKKIGFDAVYGALFPYLSAGVSYTLDRRGMYNSNNVYWNETNVHAGFELPLNISSGKQSTTLQIGSDVFHTSVNFQPPFKGFFKDQSYTYSNNYITFTNSIQQAKKNIFPRFAQVISLNYKTAISNITADQFLAKGTFYFPGLFVNQSLVISGAFQQRDRGNVINFSNDFPYSRGYTAESLYNMQKVGINYHFPIAYPDAGIANTVYFSRIRGNVFYDHTYATDFFTNGNPFKGTFRSTGAEVYFDTKFFNQGVITFGFRYSYLMDPDFFGSRGPNRFEFIVPITIF